MRRDERGTVQGPVKEQPPDGVSHGGCTTPIQGESHGQVPQLPRRAAGQFRLPFPVVPLPPRPRPQGPQGVALTADYATAACLWSVERVEGDSHAKVRDSTPFYLRHRRTETWLQSSVADATCLSEQDRTQYFMLLPIAKGTPPPFPVLPGHDLDRRWERAAYGRGPCLPPPGRSLGTLSRSRDPQQRSHAQTLPQGQPLWPWVSQSVVLPSCPKIRLIRLEGDTGVVL